MKSLMGPPRFLSEADCSALAQRAASFAVGGGETDLWIDSSWIGYVRLGRNIVSSSGDVRNNNIYLERRIRGASQRVAISQTDDASLAAAVRWAEQLLRLDSELLEDDLYDHSPEPWLRPQLWFDTTFDLDAGHRAESLRSVGQSAAAAGMLAAGFLEVGAHGRADMNSFDLSRYYPYTTAQFSVTVRDPAGTGSGWAGVDWNDWSRIDAAKISAVALDKCLKSRNPVAIEPGRYTTILEPQAVCDLFSLVIDNIYREEAESGRGPFADLMRRTTKIGQQIFDARITVSADPMDPDLGFPPFFFGGDVYHPAVWVEHGILKELAYQKVFGVAQLGRSTGLPSSGAFRMTGDTTSIDEMIATTTRGLLVTRLSNIKLIDEQSLLCSGYTRDGLWLIEKGKISKPVKNFRFTESPLFAFNQVDQLGVPVRVFHPEAPVVVPPIKVRDFSFTSLADAV